MASNSNTRMRNNDTRVQTRTLTKTQLIRRTINVVVCPICNGRGALHLGDKCTNCNTKGKVKVFIDVIIKDDLQSDILTKYINNYNTFVTSNGRTPSPTEQYKLMIKVLNRIPYGK